MTDTTLLPCPFCGCTDIWIEDTMGVWSIECNGPDCSASTNRGYGKREFAIAAWNRRDQWRTDWENAPRDGTVILAYRSDAGVFTAQYVEEDAHLATPESPPEGDTYWFTTGGEDLTEDMPTHWMPLPPAPAVTPNHLDGSRAPMKKE